ncbi:ParA family protein [Sulfobacillus harzensis]|uniref:ParA family protein n=1 Tax=Sulfobacillus harzensis TaxID=2729629 RepID=A0A7Y0L7X8_9FIRM|nr:ParA family protein [Sulfobacillus harzensis]NMP23559.1 ParA family protein [Sulfobacillus harzensis]
MPNVLVLANQKGGVMKSTLAVNLAVGFALRGYRTLVVDTDPQANASYSLGVAADEDHCLAAFLRKGRAMDRAIMTAQVLPDVAVDVIPAWISMGLVERWPDIKSAPDPHQIAERVRERMADYDWVLVDGPPHLGYWNQVALEMGDKVLIPVPQAGNYPLIGLLQMRSTIESVQMRSNPRLRLLGVVSTLVDNRTSMGRTARERLEVFIKDPNLVFETQIPRATSVEWSQAHQGANLFTTAPREPVTVAIVKLMEEVEARWQKSALAQ